MSYEGGQHLAGDPDNNALTNLFTGFNRTAAMGELYDTYLRRWRSATSNALLMHFTDVGPYSRYGSWGAIESGTTDLASSPKYKALAAFSDTAIPEPLPGSEGTGQVPDSAAPKITIAGGKRFTRNRRVRITPAWPQGSTAILLSNKASFKGAKRFSRRASITWRLRGDGPVTVRARFRGPGVDEAKTYSDRIVVDRQAPRVTRVKATRAGAGQIRIRSVVRDQYSGVAQLQVASGRRSTPQSFSTSVRDARVELAETRTVFVRFADGAGNRSDWRRVPVVRVR